MTKKTDALKRMLVGLGKGSSVSDYTGQSVVEVLKELAVILQCAESTSDIRAHKTSEIMDYIANNYGTESREPYNLTVTATQATVTMKRNGKNVTAGNDRLYNGDKLKVTATAAEGYTLTTLTANGTTIASGDTITVSGAVTIVATGTQEEE